ncbi:GTP cyclohydrolase II [Tropheryma whipplei]|nr:GTP cyclohydrolase II [Tropheryma whipplei]MCO8182496.1 GTP cyclohydrolase II [Tropheryma whipplei]MCO8190339.1 GTP cyclohydrolase II [Tropheryma whipplei]
MDKGLDSQKQETARSCRFEVETNLPTKFGTLRVRGYRDIKNNEHIALITKQIKSEDVLLRIHSECITGEVFMSLKCDCHGQLHKALERISAEGGLVIYMRGHEGRGIGILNKLRAYRLQEQGLDTFDSNVKLGLPVDARDYGPAAEILHDLGVRSVRLLSNNPDKQLQLEQSGIRVTGVLPWQVGLGKCNHEYLKVKRDKMGHKIEL